MNWKREAKSNLSALYVGLADQEKTVVQAIGDLDDMTLDEWSDKSRSIMAHVVQTARAFGWCCDHPSCPLVEVDHGNG